MGNLDVGIELGDFLAQQLEVDLACRVLGFVASCRFCGFQEVFFEFVLFDQMLEPLLINALAIQ